VGDPVLPVVFGRAIGSSGPGGGAAGAGRAAHRAAGDARPPHPLVPLRGQTPGAIVL